MVDQELLAAITKLLDDRFAAQDEKMGKKLAVHKDEVLSGVKLLIENQVTAQIKALAEGHKELAENQQDIKKQLAAITDLQDEMPVVKAAIKTHTTQIKANTAEIDKLKKAQ